MSKFDSWNQAKTSSEDVTSPIDVLLLQKTPATLAYDEVTKSHHGEFAVLAFLIVDIYSQMQLNQFEAT